MNLNQIESSIYGWANEKDLLKKENSLAQFAKVVEEVGEVGRALLKKDEKELIDGIGDVFVTLVILAEQNGLTLNQCAIAAWDEIKNRKGKTVDGTFIKA